MNRGAHALMEFTGKGKYLRSLAQGVFTLLHGLRVDAENTSGRPTPALTSW